MQDEKRATRGVRYTWGGMVWAFIPAGDGVTLETSQRYMPFVSDAPADAVFYIHRRSPPYTELGAPLFDSEGNWTLHRVEGKPVLRIRVPDYDPYQVVVLQPDLCGGDIYCVGEVWKKNGRPLSPLGYPLEEVLTVNLLARGHGVLLHASAVRDGQRGLLFSGTSGAGKSTMASIWAEGEGATVLSDDRVIVREREGRFWAYGTPWHGSARLASPEAMPLDRIFVLRHAGENRAVPLEPLEAASRLLVRSFPTFWDAQGMAFTLQFLGKLCRSVPCQELEFVPDRRVVEYLRCLSVA